MADPSSNAPDSEGSECSCCSFPASPQDFLTSALREELESRVIDHRISVEQFVRTVYGVDNALIQRVLAVNVAFPREPLLEYMDGLVRGESNETSCRPFQAILDAFVRAVREELDITDDPPLKLFTETSGYFGRDLQRMPGGIFLAPAACREAPRIDWRLVHHVLVFEDNHLVEGDESSEGALDDLKERSGPYDFDAASRHGKPTSSLSPHEMKAAQYALECMNADMSRYYTTTLCVDGTKVWLLYIDRDFVFRTASFDFVELPYLLAIVAYAMVYCTPAQAGFDPHLHFPVTTADGSSTYSNSVTYPRELAGARFVLPEDQAQPARSYIVQSPCPDYGDEVPAGRDTVIYYVKDTNSGEEGMESKICWTPVDRMPEPIILKTLHGKLPDMVGHYPVVEAWRVMESVCPLLDLLNEETRRVCLAKSSRVVYQITRRFMSPTMPLWKLDSLDEFKECFVDIVEVHFHAFKYGGILHSDIGEHSAMSHRKLGRALGVLKDWDRAHLPNDPIRPPREQPGTGTFMAVELQQSAGQRSCFTHRYHHDLESFLFLLVWATLHFDLESKRRLPFKLPDWQGEWQMAASKKRSFITDPDTFNEVIQLALPQFRGVVDGWVFPLVKLFRDAMRAADVVKVDAEGTWVRYFDEDIYAEKITFEAFMRAIGRTPRKWLHEEM